MTRRLHNHTPFPEYVRLLLAATMPSGMKGCWIHGAALDIYGYGRASGQRKAHRVVYEALVGPIPPGLVIDHLCRQRACLNPAHMEPVTVGENVTRKPRQEQCKRGHDDWIITANGWRKCATCQRETARARHRARAVGQPPAESGEPAER